jgi:hypothetical protein
MVGEAFVDLAGMVELRLARVVGVLLAALAEHAPPAGVADDERSQSVDALGVRVCRVGSCSVARALTCGGKGSGGVEQFLRDERFVGRFG